MDIQFSHIGLFVNDLPMMEAFYRDVMHFHITDRGLLRGHNVVFLSRDFREHHQIVLVSGRTAARDARLVNQISFRVPCLDSLRTFYARVCELHVPKIDPVLHGNAWSVYFEDPEGNRVEVFTDSDWYIEQPIKEHLDLSLPAPEIRRLTHSFCVGKPGFKPFAEWQAQQEARMTLQMQPG
jgi:catechol 2,3-dioxygenase